MQSSNIFENVSALAWRRLSLDTLHRYRDIVRQVSHRAFHDLDQIAEYETQRFVLLANRNELFPNPKNQFLESPRRPQRLPRYLGLTQQKAVGLQLSCQPKVLEFDEIRYPNISAPNLFYYMGAFHLDMQS
jgi:hypothetical protein